MMWTIRLVKELDLLLKSGGFHLSKYVSNCRSLLSEIFESDLSPTIVNLDFDRLHVNKTRSFLEYRERKL